jgi:hypothetical protein
MVASTYMEYYGGSNVYVSGPADTPEKLKLVIPYGDDYAADIPITLAEGIDSADCTAFMAMSKIDEPNVRIQKSALIHTTLGVLYVRYALDQDDYPTIKIGRYLYDIEVRTDADARGTKVSGTAHVVRTIVS